MSCPAPLADAEARRAFATELQRMRAALEQINLRLGIKAAS